MWRKVVGLERGMGFWEVKDRNRRSFVVDQERGSCNVAEVSLRVKSVRVIRCSSISGFRMARRRRSSGLSAGWFIEGLSEGRSDGWLDGTEMDESSGVFLYSQEMVRVGKSSRMSETEGGERGPSES